MTKILKRGYLPSDDKEFNLESLKTLCSAGQELYYLLNHGYHIKGASVFVGNHHLLSERQRLALARAVSPEKSITYRKEKELSLNDLRDKEIHIDGFNTIITLEVAFSNSLLIKCMDGTIRDLAALRGTYRLIDKTDIAIIHIGKILEKCKIGKVIFYLDAPVSNSGRLKMRILELLNEFDFEVQAEVIGDVDSALASLDNVVTSDAIILDNCISWVNLTRKIIEENYSDYNYIDLSLNYDNETSR